MKFAYFSLLLTAASAAPVMQPATTEMHQRSLDIGSVTSLLGGLLSNLKLGGAGGGLLKPRQGDNEDMQKRALTEVTGLVYSLLGGLLGGGNGGGVIKRSDLDELMKRGLSLDEVTGLVQGLLAKLSGGGGDGGDLLGVGSILNGGK